MRIGIDFDNTIVCYDQAFYLSALEKKLIPENVKPTKESIRNYLRTIGKENEWTALQGYVYGKGMDLALIYNGVDIFFDQVKKFQFDIYIISHKTKYPYIGPKYDLHIAAKEWLKKQTFFDVDCYFELTLQNKLQRIRELNCDYFIDDLPELLSEENFPKNVKALLFDPNDSYDSTYHYTKFSSWREINKFLKIS
ncbi:MAG: hypothetical protein WC688_05990 [Parachlamydiales bacterium]|jgi:hypothetical protein